MKKIDLNDVNKKVKNFFSKKTVTSYERNPERDWLFILLYSVIACIAICAIDGYLFYKINRGELFNSAPVAASTVPTLDRTLLQQEVVFYNTQPMTPLPQVPASTATTSITNTAATTTASSTAN